MELKINFKKVFVYYLVFFVGYVLLILFTSPFLMTWGSKRSFFEECYVYFLTGPFNIEFSAWLIMVNSIFWSTISYLIWLAIKFFIKK